MRLVYFLHSFLQYTQEIKKNVKEVTKKRWRERESEIEIFDLLFPFVTDGERERESEIEILLVILFS